MSDSRSRFEAWHCDQFGFTPFYYAGGYADDVELSRWLIWQAAEAQAARRCAEIVGDIDEDLPVDLIVELIKAECPEAWE